MLRFFLQLGSRMPIAESDSLRVTEKGESELGWATFQLTGSPVSIPSGGPQCPLSQASALQCKNG